MRSSPRTSPWRAGTSAVLAAILAAAPVVPRAHGEITPMTVAELQARYPDATLRQVSPEQFERLSGRVLLAQAAVTNATLPFDPDADLSPDARPPVEAVPRPVRPAATDGDWLVDMNLHGSGSFDSRDAAVIVFVLAGVVVVAFAVLYVPAFVANVLLGPDDLPPGWLEISARGAGFSGSDQQGYMGGAALAFGFEDSEGDVGVVVESGYLDADIRTVEGRDVEVAGGYVMGGLLIRWRLDEGARPPIVEVELVAGTASHYDLISRASAAFSWSLLGDWRAGLRAGSLYLNVDGDDGPLLESEDGFNLFGGIETAWRF